MARFTENGLEIDGVAEVREKFNNRAVEVFSGLTGGQTLSTDDSGVLGRIFGIVAETVALQEEAIQDGFSNLDPNQAEGSNLDDILALTGEERLDASPASATLIVFGNIGTTIAAGASAKSRTTGDVFNLNNAITFSATSSNGVEININSVVSGAFYNMNYAVDGKPSTNPPISIVASQGETIAELALRFVQTINAQTSDLTATITNDNKINVYITNRMDVGDFTVSDNMTIESSYMVVDSVSATYSAISQDPNTITSINGGATTGWISVFNPYQSVENSLVESDNDARYRWRLTKTSDSFGEYDSLYGALLQVKGVRNPNIQRNTTTSAVNSNVINSGISVVLLGGDNQEIAQTIFNNIGVGTVTNGDLEYLATDINGGLHPIKFSRPNYVPIRISMSLKALPNFPTNGKNAIKQAIVDYFNSLNTGEDILYSRLFNPINKIDGFSVNNLKIAKDNGELGVEDLVIKYNELATIRPEDILIGGS